MCDVQLAGVHLAFELVRAMLTGCSREARRRAWGVLALLTLWACQQACRMSEAVCEIEEAVCLVLQACHRWHLRRPEVLSRHCLWWHCPKVRARASTRKEALVKCFM